MKNFYLILIFTLGFTFSCKAQSQLQQIKNYNDLIVGTWISEDDLTHKVVFTSNGVCNIYIDNNLEEAFDYSLVTYCSSNLNNGYDIFLKLQADIYNSTCDIINNIGIDSNGIMILSITTERGQLETYVKQ